MDKFENPYGQLEKKKPEKYPHLQLPPEAKITVILCLRADLEEHLCLAPSDAN